MYCQKVIKEDHIKLLSRGLMVTVQHDMLYLQLTWVEPELKALRQPASKQGSNQARSAKRATVLHAELRAAGKGLACGLAYVPHVWPRLCGSGFRPCE